MKKLVLLIILLQLSFASIATLTPHKGVHELAKNNEVKIGGQYVSVYVITEYDKVEQFVETKNEDAKEYSPSLYYATFFILDKSFKITSTKITDNKIAFIKRLNGLDDEFNEKINGKTIHFKVIDIDEDSVTIQVFNEETKETKIIQEEQDYEKKKKKEQAKQPKKQPVEKVIQNSDVNCKKNQRLFQQLAEKYNEQYIKASIKNPNMKKLILPWQYLAAINWHESKCNTYNVKELTQCPTKPRMSVNTNGYFNKKTKKFMVTSTDYGDMQINSIHISTTDPSACFKTVCGAAVTSENIKCGVKLAYAPLKYMVPYVNKLTDNQIIQINLEGYKNPKKALTLAKSTAKTNSEKIIKVTDSKNAYSLMVLCKMNPDIRKKMLGIDLSSQCKGYSNV